MANLRMLVISLKVYLQTPYDFDVPTYIVIPL